MLKAKDNSFNYLFPSLCPTSCMFLTIKNVIIESNYLL